MDELQMFLPELLEADDYLTEVFTDAGAAKVEIVAGEKRTTAKYPRIVLDIEEGRQNRTSDNIAKLMNGRVRIEIVAEVSPACPDPLATVRAISGQVQDILLGNRTKQLPGVRGQRLGASYSCTKFEQARPSGPLSCIDVRFERHGLTFDVQVNRKDW